MAHHDHRAPQMGPSVLINAGRYQVAMADADNTCNKGVGRPWRDLILECRKWTYIFYGGPERSSFSTIYIREEIGCRLRLYRPPATKHMSIKPFRTIPERFFMPFLADLRRFLRPQRGSSDRGKSQDVDVHLGVFSGVIGKRGLKAAVRSASAIT